MQNLKKNFLTAGKAIFTVSNPTGTRYTFKVSKPRDKEDCPFFVSLLTGPDNWANYTYMGIYVKQGENFVLKLTAKSRYTDDTLPVKVFRWVSNVLQANQDLPTGYTIHHEGKCGRCGRRLTVPESIETGFGPECAGKVA